jgi:hypothetical protein
MATLAKEEGAPKEEGAAEEAAPVQVSRTMWRSLRRNRSLNLNIWAIKPG